MTMQTFKFLNKSGILMVVLEAFAAEACNFAMLNN